MATVEQEAVEITGIGPIEHVTLPCPAGGVVELTGTHGVGKSHALRTIEKLATGKGDVPVNDDAPQGKASGFGVSMTIGRSARRKGTADVVTLEGRFSIADLVDPGYADEAANDARRIKALVQLAGVQPDVGLFRDLFASAQEFDEIVKPASAKLTDLVAMTEAIKRDIEGAARLAEGQAEHAEGHAKASREAAGTVDESAESDADKLQAALEAAIRNEARLSEAAEKDAETIRKAKLAEAQIEDAQANYTGLSGTGAAKAVAEREIDAAEAQVKLQAAMKALNDAKEVFTDAEHKLEMAKRRQHEATTHETTIAAWRESIALAADVKPADLAGLKAARDAVEVARKAVEAGALLRKAREHEAKAVQSDALAAAAKAKAERLREAAKATDTVLNDAVARTGSSLKVHAGRLVLKTHRSEREPYSELSDGERVQVALEVATKAVGEGGLLVLPQTLWESQNVASRRRIAKQLREAKVTAYTARVTEDEELTATEFE